MMWEKVRLGDVIEILSGYAFDSKKFNDKEGVPIIRIRDIKRSFSETFYSGEYDQKYLINRGDVLIGMDGEFNISEWLGEPALLNQRVCKINSYKSELIEKKYLLHFLPLELKYIEDKTAFVTVKHLSVNDIKEIQIPLPTLPIQKRIAEILDTADALRRKDEALLKKYDELAQAIFIDMFGDPVKNEKGWEVKKFSEVSNKITDGEHATPIRQSDGIHLLSARNIQNGYISLKNGVDYISESEYNRISKRCNPEFGDILLSCSGSVGRCTVYRSSDKISLVRSVALIKPKHEKINSTYFEFSIRSEFLQNQILQNSSKSSQANLFTGKIKELNILVPHIELQKKFESIIELLTKQVSIKKIKNSENLFNSLLQKAFNGELVA